MAKPFGIQLPPPFIGKHVRAPQRSELEKVDEWQLLKERIGKIVQDLKDELAYKCATFERMIALQGQIRAFEQVLDMPEQWERDKESKEGK